MKGLDGSTPPLSANQSVHFAYILEKEETPRGMRTFFLPAAHRRAPAQAGFARFGEHSLRRK
jgi:hypothetical protein